MMTKDELAAIVNKVAALQAQNRMFSTKIAELRIQVDELSVDNARKVSRWDMVCYLLMACTVEMAVLATLLRLRGG